MAAQFTIELRGLRFFAEHGMYREELLVGNEFEVDISIIKAAPQAVITSIEETINYVEVFRTVQQEFAHRRLLLETCAMRIAEQIEQQFSGLAQLSVTIRKIHPPITNFTGSIVVTYSRSF